MLNLHVVFAVDRAGLVGEDGETHHGVFDVGFLRQIPGMMVLCPANKEELSQMLAWAVNEYDGPVAIRYPRGAGVATQSANWDADQLVCCHKDGKTVALVTYGTLVECADQAAHILEADGIHAKIIRLCCVNPLPVAELAEQLGDVSCVVVLEECCTGSGIREALHWELLKCRPDLKVYGRDLGVGFVPQGKVDRLYKEYGLDGESVAKYVQEVLKVEN